MNNPDILAFLNTFPKIQLIEAYTSQHLCYQSTPWLYGEAIRIVEVRFRANEMPAVYYETDRVLKWIKDGRLPHDSNRDRERHTPSEAVNGQ